MASGRKKADARQVTTADLVLLSLLLERPMHGYDVMKELDRQEVEDWADISRPHIYYALQKLAACGFLIADPMAPSAGARRKQVYTVSPAGKTALTAALADVGWARRRTASPFQTWLGLSVHANAQDRVAVIEARIAFVEHELARERQTSIELTNDPSARARMGEALVDLCIRQFEVELEWLRTLSRTPSF